MINDATLGATVVQAPITFTGSGDQTIVLGTVGQRLKIIGLFWVVSDSVNITLKSGASPLSGLLSMFAGGSFYRDFQQLPINCQVSDSFVINADAAITLGGMVWYIVS